MPWGRTSVRKKSVKKLFSGVIIKNKVEKH